MQAAAQDLSLMLGNLLQGSAPGMGAASPLQTLVTSGKSSGLEFMATLEESLQSLLQGDQALPFSFDPALLATTVQEYLAGQGGTPGGNGLPLSLEGGGTPALEMGELLARLRSRLAAGADTAAATLSSNPSAPSGTAGAAAPVNVVLLPGVAPEAQALLQQRRLAERFNALPELRPAALSPAIAIAERTPKWSATSAVPFDYSELMSSGVAEGAADGVVQGDDFIRQIARMAELQRGGVPLPDGAGLEPHLEGDAADVATLIGSAAQRPGSAHPLGEARPLSTFIQLPLHHPQWQSELGDRVTWLARNGGSQSAEIRLNPANLGPIEVRVVMQDDQASITFSAQHGAVRDAIEASLPRLRELFTGGGLQLANANVSDQPLHEQRHHAQQGQHGFGSGGGRSQGGYGGQEREMDEPRSVIAHSAISRSLLSDTIDLYV